MRVADQAQRERQVVDGVERADREHEVVSCRLGGCQSSSTIGSPPAASANSGPGSRTSTSSRDSRKRARPAGIGAADQQRALEPALDQRDPLEAVVERALEQEQLGPGARRPVAAQRAQLHVEQVGHAALVRCAAVERQERRWSCTALRTAARWALDFALPPRCAGCGTIVADVHSFCPDCWRQIEFLGECGCSTCGHAAAGDRGRRPAAPASPSRRGSPGRAPRSLMTTCRASLAIRLKYGRKVAIARTMARYMAPLVGDGRAIALLVPVPLHRTRLWSAASTSRRWSRASCRGGSASRPIRSRSAGSSARRRSRA